MAWPSVSDLATYLQRTLSATELAAGTLILGLAQAEIRRAVGQTLDQVLSDPAELDGNWGPKLILPERPATNVESVVINGFVLVADVDYWWAGGQRLLRGPKPSGMEDVPRWHNWGGSNMIVIVTYDHGFADIPADLADVCLKAAARSLDSGDYGLKAETIGKTSFTYNDVSVSLTQSELVQLQSVYRRSWQ